MSKFFKDKDPTFKDYLAQVGLRTLGYDPCEPDNWWGSNTEAAYQRFYKDKVAELGKFSAPQNTASSESKDTTTDVPASALKIIKEFESCLEPAGTNSSGEKLYRAYADPGYGWDLPTIGWGTVRYKNGQKVKKGDVITQSRADDLLLWEASEKAAGVKKLVQVLMTEGMFSALISFAYNVGLDAFKNSTLLKKLNAGDKSGAADEFLRWTKSAGKELAGLVRRRKAERELFLS